MSRLSAALNVVLIWSQWGWGRVLADAGGEICPTDKPVLGADATPPRIRSYDKTHVGNVLSLGAAALVGDLR